MLERSLLEHLMRAHDADGGHNQVPELEGMDLSPLGFYTNSVLRSRPFKTASADWPAFILWADDKALGERVSSVHVQVEDIPEGAHLYDPAELRDGSHGTYTNMTLKEFLREYQLSGNRHLYVAELSLPAALRDECVFVPRYSSLLRRALENLVPTSSSAEVAGLSLVSAVCGHRCGHPRACRSTSTPSFSLVVETRRHPHIETHVSRFRGGSLLVYLA